MFGSKAKKKNKEYARLVAACKEGNVADVETFLAKGRAEVNRRDDEDWTPLFWACFNGHLDIVKLLVNAGAAVQLMDKQGRSPLYLSSGWGGEEITSFLLQQNGDVTACNQDGWNCLHLCAYRGKDSVVELVLGAGCSLIQKDKQGRTPYDIAKKGNHKKVEEVLLRNAKRAILKGSEDGDHALVNGLLEQYKIDVDYTDVTGWTPLHYAAKGGRVGVVKLLYSHGCAMNLKNRAGKTALEVAEYGNDAVKMTLKKLMQEKEQKEKSDIMKAREDVDLVERKKAVQDSVDLRTRSSTAAPAQAKKSALKPELAIPAFDKTLAAKSLQESAAEEAAEKESSEAEQSAGPEAPGTPTADASEEKAEAVKSQPKEEGARLNEVLEQMKQAKAARQAKMAEQKKALMASLSDEQKQALASRRESSPSSPKGVVLSPRLMIYDKEAMAEKEAREKKEKEEREAREAAEAAAKAEAEEQARIKAEEDALARQEDPFFQRVLASEWTDLESMLDAFEIPYNESRSTRLLHLAQFELNEELGLYVPPVIEVEEEEEQKESTGDDNDSEPAGTAGEEGEKGEEGAETEEECMEDTVEKEVKAEAAVSLDPEAPHTSSGGSENGEDKAAGETKRSDAAEVGSATEEKHEASKEVSDTQTSDGVDTGEQQTSVENSVEEKTEEAQEETEAPKEDVGDAAAAEPVVDSPVAVVVAQEDSPKKEASANEVEVGSIAEESPGSEAEGSQAEADAEIVVDNAVESPAEESPVSAAKAPEPEPEPEPVKEEQSVCKELGAGEGAPASNGDKEAPADDLAAQEDAELQRLLKTYGEETVGDEEITDDLLDHFDDLLAGLDASTAGLDLEVDLEALEALADHS